MFEVKRREGWAYYLLQYIWFPRFFFKSKITEEVETSEFLEIFTLRRRRRYRLLLLPSSTASIDPSHHRRRCHQ